MHDVVLRHTGRAQVTDQKEELVNQIRGQSKFRTTAVSFISETHRQINDLLTNIFNY